jgi:hypothetical protein
MKITKSQLKQLIKEEIEAVLDEAGSKAYHAAKQEYLDALSPEDRKVYDDFDNRSDDVDTPQALHPRLKPILQGLRQAIDAAGPKNKKPKRSGYSKFAKDVPPSERFQSAFPRK